MEMNIKNYWIAVVVTLLAFPIDLIGRFLWTFPEIVPKVFFWTGIGIGGFFVIMHIIAITKKYVNENFSTPLKKAQEYFDTLNGQRRKIKKLLDFDVYGKDINEVRDHYYDLEEREFSKEALSPYLLDWYYHIKELNSRINESEVGVLEEQKEKLQEEIGGLEKEKELKQKSEKEQTNTKKQKFLEDYKDRLHIEATFLTEKQRKWLEEEGFKSTHQWCIINKKPTEFMVKPRHNENLSHAYLTSAIYSYIKHDGLDPDAQMYVTKMPDIVFSYGGFKWAIEVETGKVHQKNKKQLMEKVQMLNKTYKKGGWFFAVTNKNILSKYRKFGETVERSNIIEKIDSIFYAEGYPEE